MNLLTQTLHLLGSGASAYMMARNLSDSQTRPELLAGLQLAEAGAVPFLEALSQRGLAEGDEWLAERLSRHANDERRHSQIFAQALKQLNKQLIDLSPSSDQNSGQNAEGNPNEQRRSPFLETYYEGYTKADLSPEKIDWVMFMLSTHILELDAGKDFVRMAAILPDSDLTSVNLKKALLSIASDEKRHAAYLLEAAQRRLTYVKLSRLVDHWRERKVNALMAMLGGLLNRPGRKPSLVRDGLPVEMSQHEEICEQTAA